MKKEIEEMAIKYNIPLADLESLIIRTKEKLIKQFEEIWEEIIEFEMERIGATAIILCKCKGKCERCIKVKKVLKEAKQEIRDKLKEL